MFLQVNTFVMLNEKFENLMRNLKINTRRAMQRIRFHICEGKYNFVFLEIPRKFICPCYVERQDFAITVSFFSTDAALMIMMVTNCYNIIYQVLCFCTKYVTSFLLWKFLSLVIRSGYTIGGPQGPCPCPDQTILTIRFTCTFYG